MRGSPIENYITNWDLSFNFWYLSFQWGWNEKFLGEDLFNCSALLNTLHQIQPAERRPQAGAMQGTWAMWHGIWQTIPNFFVTNKLEADSKFFCHKQTRTRFQIFSSQTNWNLIPNFFVTYKLEPDSKFFRHKQTRSGFQIFLSQTNWNLIPNFLFHHIQTRPQFQIFLSQTN